MSDNSHDVYQKFNQRVRDALRQENTDGSPQCPAPELLWEWVEQQDAHPQAAWLLDHYITCAYCRRQHAAFCEIRALTLERQPERQSAEIETGLHSAPTPQSVPSAAAPHATCTNDVRRLAGKVRAWAQELLEAGTLAPLSSLRVSLERLQRFSLDLGSAAARGADVPMGLRPALTAVRSPQPTLRWRGIEAAPQYLVTIARPQAKARPRPIWTGRVEGAAELTLPHEAGLKPGEVYLWEVIAYKDEQEYPSSAVPFLVLSETLQRQMEVWEQEAGDSPLARISVYEAYGLYEEALQAAEEWSRHDPDAAALRIHAALLRRLQRSEADN